MTIILPPLFRADFDKSIGILHVPFGWTRTKTTALQGLMEKVVNKGVCASVAFRVVREPCAWYLSTSPIVALATKCRVRLTWQAFQL